MIIRWSQGYFIHAIKFCFHLFQTFSFFPPLTFLSLSYFVTRKRKKRVEREENKEWKNKVRQSQPVIQIRCCKSSYFHFSSFPSFSFFHHFTHFCVQGIKIWIIARNNHTWIYCDEKEKKKTSLFLLFSSFFLKSYSWKHTSHSHPLSLTLFLLFLFCWSNR